MNDNEKVKDKIRKLLALAGDPAAFDGEISNALRFARRYMLQHNISEDQLGKTRDPHEAAADVEYHQACVYSYGKDMSKWEGYLMYAICQLFGTLGSYRKSGRVAKLTAHGTIWYDSKGQTKNVTQLFFFGPTEDVRDALVMFDEWVELIIALSRLKFGSWIREDARSYNEGFVTGIINKLKEIKEEERVEIAKPTGTSLVVVNATNLMLAKKRYGAEWLRKEQNIKLGKGHSHRNKGDNRESFQKGVVDGSKAGFSRDRTLKIEA